MEVNETTLGNFLSDNSNLDIQANVGGQAFYHYGVSGTAGFDIGSDAPPSTAYGSGLTRTQSSGSVYYDEFGTSSGIASWMSTEWGVASPNDTQIGGAYLPDLNVQYYLTIDKSGGAGCPNSDCYALPSSGYYLAGQVVTITAYSPDGECISGLAHPYGYYFDSWSGTGSGSYTGSDNPATVTMNAPITETAQFSHTDTCWNAVRG